MIIVILIFILSLTSGIIGAYFIFKDKSRLLGILLICIAIAIAFLGFLSDFISRQQINRIEKYSNIAKMMPCGSDTCMGKGLHFTGGLGGDLEGTYIMTEDKFTYKCDKESIDKMIKVTKNYPDFPFSYYSIATCKKDRGEEGWKEYAERAIDIFEETTQIKDHNSAHDEGLEDLKNDLDPFGGLF